MTEITLDQINAMRQRIIAAKRGEADMPTREELRATYAAIRSMRLGSHRATAPAEKPGKRPSTSAPVDLASLFGQPSPASDQESS